MKKSKGLSVLLVIAMLFSCCFSTHTTTAIAASTLPSFVVSNESGKPGEDVTVTVDIANNPGICTALIWVNYADGLKLKSATDSKLLVGGIFGGDKTANPYGLYWDDSTNPDGDNSSNGTIATLVFTIEPEAANGDYSIWITYTLGDVYNIDLDEIEFTCVAGKISVTGGVCNHKYTDYISNNDATCERDGTKTASCDNGCGATDTITDINSRLPHKYTSYTSNNNATCERDGTKTAFCDYGCGTTNTLTEENSKLDHKYTTYISNNDATCEADGTKTAVCDYGCGETNTIGDSGSIIPHSFRPSDYSYNDDSTCFADGTETATCEYGCGTKDTRTKIGSRKTHSFTSYEYNEDATYASDGTETAVCDYYCGTEDTRTKVGSKLVDTIPPIGEVSVKENKWKTFLNTISFGLFCKDKFDVSITAEDNETGVATIEYIKSETEIAEDAIDNVTNWTKGTSLSVNEEGQYVIYVKIVDNSGNVTYISTNGIVVDTTAPTIDGIVNNGKYCTNTAFTVSDTYLKDVTVNGTSVYQVNGTSEYPYELEATSESGTEYTVTATDKAGNSTTVTVTVYDGHAFDTYVSNNDATCTADGTKTASCSNGCGATDTVADTNSKKEHSFTSYISNNDATCTVDGTKSANCDYGCGETDTITDVGSKHGHKYTAYSSNGDATCTADGTETADCDYGCGESDTRTAVNSKFAHKYTNYVDNHDATCSADGTETASCDYGCGEQDTRDIEGSRKEHSYTNYTYEDNATYFADGTEIAYCDYACGKTDRRTKAGTKLVDSICPTGKIVIKGNSWESSIEVDSFEICYKERVTVSITATDEETGISTIEYYKSATAIAVDDIKDISDWTEENSFSVEGEEQFIVYVKISDNAGNVTYINTDGIMVDTVAPVIGGLSNQTYCEQQTFTVTDTYLEEVTVNNNSAMSYELVANDRNGTEYTVTATDKAGNSTTVTVTVYDGHAFDTYVSNNDATCTADGTKTASCSNGCGATDTVADTNSKKEHSFTSYTSNNDATCTVDGTETASCDYGCGETNTRTDVGSKSHKYTVYLSDNNATCTADGTETALCDFGCGSSDTHTEVNSKISHKYTHYVSNNDASCTVDGTETALCDYGCGNSDTRTNENSKLGHKYTIYICNNDATCRADGTKTSTCDHGCGTKDTIKDRDTRVDHKYTDYVSNNDATCQKDGTKTAHCDYGCGATDTVVEEGTKTDHKYTNYVSNNDATCIADGTETAQCDYKCGETNTRDDKDSKHGHKYGEWTVVAYPTESADGEMIRECAICHDRQSETLVLIVSETSKIEGAFDKNAELVVGDVTSTMDKATKAKIESGLEELITMNKLPDDTVLVMVQDIELVIKGTSTEIDPLGKVKVTISIPTNLTELYDDINMVHFKDNGSCEVVKLTINDDNTATFETDGFSYYALTGVAKGEVNKVDSSIESQAGNKYNVVLWIVIFALLLAGGLTTFLFKKKKSGRH